MGWTHPSIYVRSGQALKAQQKGQLRVDQLAVKGLVRRRTPVCGCRLQPMAWRPRMLLASGDFVCLEVVRFDQGSLPGRFQPTRYAPIAGGIDPDLTPIRPKIAAIGTKPAIWDLAAQAAERVWLSVQTETLTVPLLRAIRQVSAQNLKVARAFSEPRLSIAPGVR